MDTRERKMENQLDKHSLIRDLLKDLEETINNGNKISAYRFRSITLNCLRYIVCEFAELKRREKSNQKKLVIIGIIAIVSFIVSVGLKWSILIPLLTKLVGG